MNNPFTPASHLVVERRNKARYNRQTRYMAPPHTEPLRMALPRLIRVMWDECSTGVWNAHSCLELQSLAPYVPAEWLIELTRWHQAMGKALNSSLSTLAEVVELDRQGLALAQQLVRALQGQQSRGKSVKVVYWRESVSLCGWESASILVSVPRGFGPDAPAALADQFVRMQLLEVTRVAQQAGSKPHCLMNRPQARAA